MENEDYAPLMLSVASYPDLNNSLDANTSGVNGTFLEDEADVTNHPAIQAIFYVFYTTIFGLGIFGNVLVCYVVGRNKAMQTVTNFFITNMALADILLCALAVPFTPLYTFLQAWIFGRVLCHLVPPAQGTSVYISTMTLTSIAVDRFFVIIYPFKPRMRLTTCLIIILSIWAFAILMTIPYGIFLKYEYRVDLDVYICTESWPSEPTRKGFSGFTSSMQFLVPFIIITICYVRVSIKLSDRAKAKLGTSTKNSRKEAMERERKRRTNRMLIAMVAIFGISWLPLNLINLFNDVYIDADKWPYYNLLFFVSHAIAMSSTCYNPFLYAWLNENFRKEFKQVLPCFHLTPNDSTGGPTSNRTRRFQSERTCNGNGNGNNPNDHDNDTVQESFLKSDCLKGEALELKERVLLDPIEEFNSMEQNTSQIFSKGGPDDDEGRVPMAHYSISTDEVQIHFPDATSFLNDSVTDPNKI